MAETNGDHHNNNVYQFIPHGGPLYAANLVSSLTKPPLFQSQIISELQALRDELGQDFNHVGEEEDDLSVDELKIVTEEELVDKAFDIAFKDDQVPEQCPQEEMVDKAFDVDDQVPKQCPREEELVDKAFDNETIDNDKLSELENNAIQESSKRGNNGRLSDVVKKKKGKKRKCQNNDRKRKRDDSETKDKKRKSKRRNGETVEESYMEKVKQLVRIKEKQFEDKAAAKLHSFDGSCSINDNATNFSSGRTTSLKSNNSTAKARISGSHEGQVLEPGKEVVLCVEVYHNTRTWQKTQEFLVLGRQCLSELRDKIYCLTDQLMEKEGHHDSSGYFLVEDVFYNDLRDATAIDYSKPIFDWLEDSKKEAQEKWEYILSGRLKPKQKELVDNKKKENLPRFKAFQMHEKRFCDLNFRLGAEYLYCHQGDCKHTIVIRDMRLNHPEDVQDQCAYPVVTFRYKPRIQKCSACQIFRAKLVTVDDKWAGENPCYFCDTCYYMLHYANESLLYPDFSVFDYQYDQI